MLRNESEVIGGKSLIQIVGVIKNLYNQSMDKLICKGGGKEVVPRSTTDFQSLYTGPGVHRNPVETRSFFL